MAEMDMSHKEVSSADAPLTSQLGSERERDALMKPVQRATDQRGDP